MSQQTNKLAISGDIMGFYVQIFQLKNLNFSVKTFTFTVATIQDSYWYIFPE